MVVKHQKDSLQIDLADLSFLTKQNRNFKYFLAAINCFSKEGYAIALKLEQGKEVAQALEAILCVEKCSNLQCDPGSEFYNPHIKALVNKFKINQYSIYSIQKASTAKRFIRTVQTRLFKYNTGNI